MHADSYLPCISAFYGAEIPTYNLGDYGGCHFIASPGYPYMYRDRDDCRWSIEASVPENRIQLEVVEWDVSQVM